MELNNASVEHKALAMMLHNPALVRNQLFIDGTWQASTSNRRFDVLNPANNCLITQVADADEVDVKAAIESANRAQKEWALQPAKTRSHYLKKWYQLIIDNSDDLAIILTCEQGKPLAEAQAEITYGASYIEWFAEEAMRVNGDVLVPPSPNMRLQVIKQAVGVVGAITPWNFPCAMLARKIAPALAAGCALVAKPAAETPLSALALAYLATEAGIPAGIINILPSSNAQMVGMIFCEHKGVHKLTFTGSTAVGKKLIAQIAPEVKRISLELGGNAPFVVFDDADLDSAVEGAIASKFRNAGQTCVCSNRFYIHSSIASVFTEKLLVAVAHLTIGNGLNKNINIGPLISPKAVNKVNGLVQRALAAGAQLRYSSPLSEIAGSTGNYFPIQILSNVKFDAEILAEEIFGPVMPLVVFDDEGELLNHINASPYGLAAYFYSKNNSRIWRFAEQLDVGMVGVNTGLISNAVAPFGGVKQSGWGREGSSYGIAEYLNLKYVCQSL